MWNENGHLLRQKKGFTEYDRSRKYAFKLAMTDQCLYEPESKVTILQSLQNYLSWISNFHILQASLNQFEFQKYNFKFQQQVNQKLLILTRILHHEVLLLNSHELYHSIHAAAENPSPSLWCLRISLLHQKFPLPMPTVELFGPHWMSGHLWI